MLHCIWQQMAQHCMSRAQSKHRQSLQGGKWQYIRSQNLWISLEVVGSDENMKLQLGHDLLPNSVSGTGKVYKLHPVEAGLVGGPKVTGDMC